MVTTYWTKKKAIFHLSRLFKTQYIVADYIIYYKIIIIKREGTEI